MAMPAQIEWRDARLRATLDITPDIRLFEIEASGAFVAPTPGSHIKVIVHIDGRPDTRSYSVIGPCTDGVYRIAVKLLHNSRGGSAYMWKLSDGAKLVIATPKNHFALGHQCPEYLLLAGGIGITPIYSMALALSQSNAKFRLLYCCRGRDDLAFAGELKDRVGDRLKILVDEDGDRLECAAEIGKLDRDGELYVCGPIGMLEAAKRCWRDSGRPEGQFRFETFGNSGQFASEPFKVRLPRLDLEIDVAANQTILDALEAAGVEMIFDCRRGECGLCALSIQEINGTVDHRDVFFSDEEKSANTKLCTCVSRVVGGSITLDTGDRSPVAAAR
jgi:ferredoxin-NADP reductase